MIAAGSAKLASVPSGGAVSGGGGGGAASGGAAAAAEEAPVEEKKEEEKVCSYSLNCAFSTLTRNYRRSPTRIWVSVSSIRVYLFSVAILHILDSHIYFYMQS